MRVLIVGAGAVGQVLGVHLQRGGAEVTFFVREKYRKGVEQGFRLYPLNGKRGVVSFSRFGLVSSAEEVARGPFDQVYLTVSSAAIRGPWLAELVSALRNATVISLQPSPDDQTVVKAAGVPAERLVSGMTSLISYFAPLPGEARFPLPGTAYWFFPLAPSRFSGSKERVAEVVRALSAGGLPARAHQNVARTIAFPTAILTTYVSALGPAGWDVELGARGATEAIDVIASDERRKPLWARIWTWPWFFRVVLRIARSVAPLPLDAYFRSHAAKIDDQTKLLLETWISKGKRAGIPVGTLQVLASRE